MGGDLKDLRDKYVLVTGGASGIGKSLAHRFLMEGSNVAIVDICPDKMEQTCEQYKGLGNIIPYQCDISKSEMVYELLKKVECDFGQIDILVNNAGILDSNLFLDKSPEIIERTIAVNFLALCWTIKAFLPGMIERNNGKIVNMASAGGYISTPYTVDYCASKHAVIGLVKGLRREIRLMGITGVSLLYVCPGMVNTGMVKGASLLKGGKAFMEPDWLVEKIIQAIKTNKKSLHLPPYVRFIPVLEALFPASFVDKKYEDMGLSSSMAKIGK